MEFGFNTEILVRKKSGWWLQIQTGQSLSVYLQSDFQLFIIEEDNQKDL